MVSLSSWLRTIRRASTIKDRSCCLLGSVVKPLPVYPAGVWFDPARVHLQFLNSRNVFDWLDPGSIPTRVRRKIFRLPASRNPGSNPPHDRVRSLMSLACRLRSERPGFDSGFGSTAFRGIGRCRLRATETQQATPRNYADGRDRRRREAAATAPRAWSRKCPGEPTLKCGDKGCFYTRRAQ